jgi:hypothetical protein
MIGVHRESELASEPVDAARSKRLWQQLLVVRQLYRHARKVIQNFLDSAIRFKEPD